MSVSDLTDVMKFIRCVRGNIKNAQIDRDGVEKVNNLHNQQYFMGNARRLIIV